MEKTWKPTTAGILSIVAGVPAAIGGLTVGIVGGTMAWWDFPLAPRILAAVGVPMLILGIVAIVGGIYALKRKVWGLALAGAICALLSPAFILGILAIIFVVMAKGEFEQTTSQPPE